MFDIFPKVPPKNTIFLKGNKKNQSYLQTKKLCKKHFLCQEGAIWHCNTFIYKGLVKTFSIAENRTEHTLNFAAENYWTGDRDKC